MTTTHGNPETTETAQRFTRALQLFDDLVHRIAGHQWHLPTPCEDWDVQALVNHVTAEDLWVAPLLAGRTIEEVGDRYDGDVLGDSPGAAWSAAATTASSAITAPHGLDRQVHLSSGATPAEAYVAELFADHLVHAWDLATALGIDLQLPADLVGACATWFASMEDLYREAGAIGPRADVSVDADAQTRLLAAFGRTTTD